MVHNKKPGRPRIYKNRKKITVHLSAALLRRLKKYAKGEQWSLSAAVVDLLKRTLDK